MIKLKMTCGAYPEQYDAYWADGKYAGYFRLRHGSFRVENDEGKIIHVSHPRGDGIFEEVEREYELSAGCHALLLDKAKRDDGIVERLYEIEGNY